MTSAYVNEVKKLEKLRTAWQPAVDFLFGSAVPEAKFDGFDVTDGVTKPTVRFKDCDNVFRYTIEMPIRSFSNDVMLLADVIQEMVRGLYPVGNGAQVPVLCEGVAVFGAITAIKQVFGEKSVDSYLNALKENAFAYYDAFSYVAVLLAEDPEAIKKLRKIKPFLYQVERSDFDVAGVDLERKMKDILLLTFRG